MNKLKKLSFKRVIVEGYAGDAVAQVAFVDDAALLVLKDSNKGLAMCAVPRSFIEDAETTDEGDPQ